MARAAKAPLPEPTEEQLQIAFRELWRPGRPDTVETMLQHPTLAICLRGIARARTRVLTRNAVQRPAAAVVVPPSPEPQALRRTPASAPQQARAAHLHRAPKLRFDARKAAANDRDDD